MSTTSSGGEMKHATLRRPTIKVTRRVSLKFTKLNSEVDWMTIEFDTTSGHEGNENATTIAEQTKNNDKKSYSIEIAYDQINEDPVYDFENYNPINYKPSMRPSTQLTQEAGNEAEKLDSQGVKSSTMQPCTNTEDNRNKPIIVNINGTEFSTKSPLHVRTSSEDVPDVEEDSEENWKQLSFNRLTYQAQYQAQMNDMLKGRRPFEVQILRYFVNPSKYVQYEVIYTMQMLITKHILPTIFKQIKNAVAAPDRMIVQISVFRRYNEFKTLYSQLEEEYKGLVIPSLPGKQIFPYFGGRWKDPSFLSQRQDCLNLWLHQVLDIVVEQNTSNILSNRNSLSNVKANCSIKAFLMPTILLK